MAIQFVDGAILFVSGAIAMHADCCCGGEGCCDAAIGEQLFLTISDLTLDGGETCDDGCEADITAGSLGTWDGTGPLTWLADEGNPGTALLAALTCVDNQLYLSILTKEKNADGDTLCDVVTDPDPQAITGYTCDPFYWEGDLTITALDDTATPCGTGTIHVILSE